MLHRDGRTPSRRMAGMPAGHSDQGSCSTAGWAPWPRIEAHRVAGRGCGAGRHFGPQHRVGGVRRPVVKQLPGRSAVFVLWCLLVRRALLLHGQRRRGRRRAWGEVQLHQARRHRRCARLPNRRRFGHRIPLEQRWDPAALSCLHAVCGSPRLAGHAVRPGVDRARKDVHRVVLRARSPDTPSSIPTLRTARIARDRWSRRSPSKATATGSSATTPPSCSFPTDTYQDSNYWVTPLWAYRFTGFAQPIDNGGVWNTVKAGSAIPVKFSLGGAQGMDVINAGSPTATETTCPGASAALDAVEETVTASQSGLTYDASADQYIYVWKTEQGVGRQVLSLRSWAQRPVPRARSMSSS